MEPHNTVKDGELLSKYDFMERENGTIWVVQCYWHKCDMLLLGAPLSKYSYVKLWPLHWVAQSHPFKMTNEPLFIYF